MLGTASEIISSCKDWQLDTIEVKSYKNHKRNSNVQFSFEYHR